MPRKPRMITCPQCLQEAKHYAKGLCARCYRIAHRPKLLIAECAGCHRVRPIAIKCRELCHSCATMFYQRKNPDYKKRHARQERDRRARDPEKYREYERRRSQTPKRKAWQEKYNREYYQKNQERFCEYQRQWRKDHPEQRDHYKRTRRAREQGLAATLTLNGWYDILDKFNHSCAYCQSSDIRLIREHKLPVSKGGGFTPENIVPSCDTCNYKKSDMTAREFVDAGYASNPHPLLLEHL